MGHFYLQAYRALSDRRLLDTARAAGETTYALGDVRRNPSQCHGLAGSGELFVELYRETADARWLDRAVEFAAMAARYRYLSDGIEVWQSDEAGQHSQDFLSGAAGTGHFLLRVAAPFDTAMPLM